jgi:hypothetical protein
MLRRVRAPGLQVGASNDDLVKMSATGNSLRL